MRSKSKCLAMQGFAGISCNDTACFFLFPINSNPLTVNIFVLTFGGFFDTLKNDKHLKCLSFLSSDPDAGIQCSICMWQKLRRHHVFQKTLHFSELEIHAVIQKML